MALSDNWGTPPGSPGLPPMTASPTLQRNWSRRRSVDDYRATRSSVWQLAPLLLYPVILYAVLRLALGVTHQACLVISIMALYAGFTETVRVPRYRNQSRELHSKVRELIEARRAAGLQRLGAEVAARQQNWPRPPYSYTATVLGRFDADRATPLHDREVDYRSLACDAVARVLELIQSIDARQGALKASAAHSWLLQRLMHDGPSPEKDPEIFQELHKAIDIAEQRGESRGYYCRLCLGYQTSGLSKSFKVQMDCGKCLCSRCAKELVEGVLEGRVRLPLACPTGNCTSVLTPNLVQHLLEDEDYDRFKRMHDVKMSLDRSAPHKDGLAARLAEARSLGSSQGSQHGAGKGTTLSTVAERSESRDGSPSLNSKLRITPVSSPRCQDISAALLAEHPSPLPDGKSPSFVGIQNLTVRSSPTRVRSSHGFGRAPGVGQVDEAPGSLLSANQPGASPPGTPTTSSPSGTSFSSLLQPLMPEGSAAKKHSD